MQQQEIKLMVKVTFLSGIFLLAGLQSNAMAYEEGFRPDDKTVPVEELSPEQIEAKRQDILAMPTETLKRLYKDNPLAKEEIEDAYGYAVFDGQVVNAVLYVGGKGFGVAFDNKTKTPIYMDSYRAGTGPGVGYKSYHAVFIFDNETVYKQFTTIGLQVSASADIALQIEGKGAATGTAFSMVPGISYYEFTNTGLVIQANWGGTEFLKDAQLNE